jgi:hypothetical protein
MKFLFWMKYNLVLEGGKFLHTNFIILSQISFAWLKEWGTDLLEAS